MNTNILTLAVLLFVTSVATGYNQADEQTNFDIKSEEDATMHFYVLLVPETSVRALRQKTARQEEEGAVVTETGVYVGQIISGVLGGDIRPVFAGSASFIGEPDVQQGVSTILANVAPSINNVLKQWVGRVQTALGLATTVKPGSVVLSNQTRPSNGVVVGRPISAAEASKLTPQQILQQQQIAQAQQEVASGSKPLETVEGSNVISGSVLFSEQTTVEPLPLINLKTPDEDEEESDRHDKVVSAI